MTTAETSVDDTDDTDDATTPPASGALPPVRRFETGAAVLVALAATVTSLGLRALAPLWLVVYNVDDDQLYVRLGHSLLGSEWLGAFDSRTLQKPPGYSMFIAMAHRVPIAFVTVQHCFYLAAAAVVALGIHRLVRRPLLAAMVYSVLVLDPTMVSGAASRLLRDNWYTSISLLLFGLAMYAVPSVGAAGSNRSGTIRSIANSVGLGLITGVVLTGYWLGRSERPWLLAPLLGLLVGGFAVRARAFSLVAPELPRRRALMRAGTPLAIAIVGALVVLALSLEVVGSKNESAYGVNVVEDMYSGPFADMYGAWQSVNAGPARRFVPISQPQREAVYAVSPAARELEPLLEDPSNIYVGFGCQVADVCDDFMAGWLPFALRDATNATGHFTTAPAAHEYWSRVTREIRAACADGRLTCSRAMPATLPSPSRISLTAWLRSTVTAMNYLVDMGQADPKRPLSGTPSTPDEAEQFAMFSATLRGLPADLPAQQGLESDAALHWPLLEHIVGLYRWMLRLGLPLALIGVAWAGVRRRDGWSRPFWIGVCAVAAAASRVVTVAFVDSTTFPAADSPSYVLPTAPLLDLVVVVGVAMLLGEVRDLVSNGQGRGLGGTMDMVERGPSAGPADHRGEV